VEEMNRVLVTGGADFLGCHLVNQLVGNHDADVLDDLSGGTIENIRHHLDKIDFRFIDGRSLYRGLILMQIGHYL
jgi:UDP-glucose 4-epimerase